MNIFENGHYKLTPTDLDAYFSQPRTEITPTDQLLFYQRLEYRQMFSRLRENLWVSPDIATTEEVVLPSNTLSLVPVTLPLDDLPIPTQDPYLLSVLHPHTRSRYAQLGLEVTPDFGHFASCNIDVSTNTAYIPVTNHSGTNLKLLRGQKFFNLYYSKQNRLYGQDLIDSIVQGNIQIHGQQGEDWDFAYYPDPNYPPQPVGLKLFLNPDFAKHIKPNSNPLTIDDGESNNHNRQQVDQHLQSINHPTTTPTFWVGQTLAKLQLTPKVHGFLDPIVELNDKNQYPSQPFQTFSLVMNGNNTNSHIRTEIISPTHPKLRPQSVVFYFTPA